MACGAHGCDPSARLSGRIAARTDRIVSARFLDSFSRSSKRFVIQSCPRLHSALARRLEIFAVSSSVLSAVQSASSMLSACASAERN